MRTIRNLRREVEILKRQQGAKRSYSAFWDALATGCPIAPEDIPPDMRAALAELQAELNRHGGKWPDVVAQRIQAALERSTVCSPEPTHSPTMES